MLRLNRSSHLGRQITKHQLQSVAFAAAVFLLLALVMGACADETSELLMIDEQIGVTGNVDLGGIDAADSQLQFHLIHPEKGRQPLAVEVDATGGFYFEISSSDLFPNLSADPALRAFLGGRAAEKSAFKDRAVGRKVEAILRFEITRAFAADAKEIDYHQQVTAISLGQLLSAGSQIIIGQNKKISLQPVGRRRVNLTSGDAYVSSIPAVTTAELDLSRYLGYLPVATQSVAGSADVYPLPIEGSNPQYQVLAWQNLSDYLYVSEVINYSRAEAALTIATLAKRDAAVPFGSAGYLQYRRPIKAQLLSDPELGEGDQYVGYVNQEQIQFEQLLPAAGHDFSGIAVQVFAGTEARGDAYFDETFYNYASVRSILVPRTFAAGSTENGSFSIAITDLQSGEQTLLYGVKSVGRPTFDEAALTVQAATGYEGILSGLPGAKLGLRYAGCPSLGEVGILEPAAEDRAASIRFVSCAGGELEYLTTIGSLLPGIGAGGSYNLSFYLKDRFGNLSSPLVDGSLQNKEVYLDFSGANLAEQSLTFGFHFGFAEAGEPSGSDAAPFNFAAGTIIDEVNRESTVLRFASSALCRHNAPNTGDGSTLGHYLAGFRLAQNAIDAKALYSDYTSCGADLALDETNFKLPTEIGAAAALYLQVIDRAGNPSNVQPYAIPHCDGRPGDFNGCWQ